MDDRDDCAHLWVCDEFREGMAQNRLTVEATILFGDFTAETMAAPSGDNEGGDLGHDILLPNSKRPRMRLMAYLPVPVRLPAPTGTANSRFGAETQTALVLKDLERHVA